jgi:hypothetical protein
LEQRWTAIYTHCNHTATVNGVPITEVKAALPTVVQLILNQTWGVPEQPVRKDKGDKPKALWNLFDCKAWLIGLPYSIENEIKLDTASEVLDSYSKTETAFPQATMRVGRLLRYFKSLETEKSPDTADLELDRKALETLMSADLGEEDMNDTVCMSRTKTLVCKKVNNKWCCCSGNCCC